MIKDYLEKNQPLFYRIIRNQILNNKLPHAFLINKPQNDYALLYIAMSLVCDELYACETCADCVRIKNHTYSDVVEYDGLKESIKKEHIEKIQARFKNTSLEGKSRIYILKNIEYSSTEAMNSLLKMLEEPQPGIYAIFTTQNMNKVLPTIISRCQIFDMKIDLRETFKEELIKTRNYSEQKANVLSILMKNVNEIDELDEKMIDYVMEQAIYFIEDMYFHRDNLIINTQTHMLKEYKGKKEMKLFIQMIILGMKDMFHVKHNDELIFCEKRDLFQSIVCDNSDIIKKIELLLDTLNLIDTNANIPLLMDSMMYRI